MRRAQVALHLGVANFGVTRPNAADIGAEEGFETLASLRRQVTMADPGGIDPPIVVEGGGKQFRGEVLANRRPFPLLR